MNPYRILSICCLLMLPYFSQAQFDWRKKAKDLEKQAKDATGQNGSNLSNADIISGLKEALNVGTGNATKVVSAVNGYYNNPVIKIPFPPQVQRVQETLISMGLKSQVDQFVESLNRAAEEAAKSAVPVFVDAVKQMTINDGLKILQGRDNEATLYLKDKTSVPLKTKYKPIVKSALDKVQATKYWTQIASVYNKIPFVEKVNPDLEDYTTQKALDGLFYMVGQEEAKIRKDPGARVTDILKKVFGKK